MGNTAIDMRSDMIGVPFVRGLATFGPGHMLIFSTADDGRSTRAVSPGIAWRSDDVAGGIRIIRRL